MNVFFRILCIVLALGITPASFFAQDVKAVSDPIVDMLDSLCTLEGLIECQPEKEVNYSGFNLSNEIISARMASRPSPIPFEINDEVRKYIELYALKRKELVKRVLGMAEMYFPLFEEALDKEGLPLELKYLSIVESALNPLAVSRAGATGIWQFMYQTAKMYDMKINSYVDERRDPEKATYAMTRYFKDMYALYNDWLLSIAAYNCGPNNVNKAILRSGGKTNFWEIAPFLPAETRGYVPAFLAVCYVMQFAEQHDLTPVPPKYSYFDIDTIIIVQGASLYKVAAMLDMTYHELIYLNPSYKKGIIPPGYKGVLRIPKSKLDNFIARYEKVNLEIDNSVAPVLAKMNLDADGNPAKGYRFADVKIKKTHIVKRNETLQSIAKRYQTSVAEIKRINKLHHNNLRAGQKLMVYVTSRKIVPDENTASNETVITPELENSADSNQEIFSSDFDSRKIILHTVEKGDTLWNIAKRYEGASVQQIMKINNLNSPEDLKLGAKIKIPLGS
jgi:membrane-bound lytic murein transglycosylase D